MSLGERLKIARLEKGISQTELAKGVGVSQAAIGALEKRGSRSCGYTAQLAKLLGVSIEWLATGVGESTRRGSIQQTPIPVISWETIFTTERKVESYVPFYGTLDMEADECFGVRVTGISMEPEFKDGDTVIVDTLKEPKHNDFVIANIDGQPTLKQLVIEEGRLFLRALNPAWTPTLIPIKKETQIAGIILAKTRSY
jgi:SOS-response transcriptional repressor LexA